MGNSHQARRLQDDFDISSLRGQSITFHSLHSDSIRLSNDNRVAKRVSSFRGICFSNRPICIGERVHLRIAETAPSAQSVGRDGVLRVGLLPDDPSMLNTADLPTYACPDITYEQGYWAQAVPEQMARLGNVLFFYVTAAGDVMYGLNGKEMGVFFGGVQTDMPLWALLDLYGTTCCVELIDGFQFGLSNSYAPSPIDMPWLLSSTQPIIPDVAPFYPLPPSSPRPPTTAPAAWPSHAPTATLPVLHRIPHQGQQGFMEVIDPMPFHLNSGRNVSFSMNRMVASRGHHDYCNGYVFTSRPLSPGERLVISVQAVTNEYSGGLAFGMTSCNPSGIDELALPDDSDLLLDFPDYWVVHKDVYTKPEINDELSFHLTTSGEVRYAKNGHHVGSLMHVDTSLHLWAFFDIYGSTQQIKSLGVVTPMLSHPPHPLSSGASVTLRHAPSIPTSSSSRAPTFSSSSTAMAPNVRSLSSFDNPNRLSDAFSALSLADAPRQSRTVIDSTDASRRHSYADAPALPPKLSQNRSASVLARMSPPILAPSSSLNTAPTSFSVTAPSPLDLVMNVSEAPPSLPPPLIPMPGKTFSSSPKPIDQQPVRPRRRPVPPRRTSTAPAQTVVARSRSARDPISESSEECVVCMERSTDCALYMCGHMCMCYECAVDIVNNQSGLCPICREPIRDIIKIFRS